MDPLRHHGDVDADAGAARLRGQRPGRGPAAAGCATGSSPRWTTWPATRPPPHDAARPRGRRRAARPPSRRGARPRRAAPRGSRCSRRCGRGWPRSCTPGSPSPRRRCGPPGCRWCGCSPTPPTGTACGPTPCRPRRDLVVVGNPTNPTGVLHPAAALRALRRARAGSCSSTRRSPTPCPASPSRWPARRRACWCSAASPRPGRSPGCGRATRSARRRCWPGSPRPARRGRCRRSRWRRCIACCDARRRGGGRAGRPRPGAAAGRAGRGARGACPGSRCCPGARRSCCCGCPTARASGCAHALRAAGHRGAAGRHVPRPRARPPAGRRPAAAARSPGCWSRRCAAALGRAGRASDDAHGVGDVIAALEAAYPPALAADWDAVGLVCGDPAEPVASVLVAVDPVPETVDEAVAAAPSCSSPTTRCCCAACTGSAPTPRRARSCTASSARAPRCSPRTPTPTPPTPASPTRSPPPLGLDRRAARSSPRADRAARQDHHVRPGRARDHGAVHDALSAAGAGNIGDYSHCSFATAGTGQFKPLAGAHPAIGEVGRLERVAETRLEMVLPRAPAGRRRGRAAGRAPLRGARVRRAGAGRRSRRRGASAGSARCPRRSRSPPSPRGSRPGLPATAWGVRAAGDPDRTVRRVAVCGGAGDSALDAALAAGVDAYVTADLRHHPASEHLLRPGPRPRWSTSRTGRRSGRGARRRRRPARRAGR